MSGHDNIGNKNESTSSSAARYRSSLRKWQILRRGDLVPDSAVAARPSSATVATPPVSQGQPVVPTGSAPSSPLQKFRPQSAGIHYRKAVLRLHHHPPHHFDSPPILNITLPPLTPAPSRALCLRSRASSNHQIRPCLLCLRRRRQPIICNANGRNRHRSHKGNPSSITGSAPSSTSSDLRPHSAGSINHHGLPENDVRIDVGELLKVNFDPAERVETENWTALVIEPLPFAAWGDLCIVLFRKFNKEDGVYDARELNALPTEKVGFAEAGSRISQHPAHQVALAEPADKNIPSADSWAPEFILGKDLGVKSEPDIYRQCSQKAKSLLNITFLNAAQQKAIELVKRPVNGIGLITGPAATGKTLLLVAMVMPFLWAPASESGDPSAITPTLGIDNNAADKAVKPGLNFNDVATCNDVEPTLDSNDNSDNGDPSAITPTLGTDNNAAAPPFDHLYVQSRLAGYAMSHVIERLRPGSAMPITTSDEILDVLRRVFEDPNRKTNMSNEFRSLQMRDRTFEQFWAEFQRLSAPLDPIESTLIEILRHKLSPRMKEVMIHGFGMPNSLHEYATQCNLAYQRMKEAERSRQIEDRYTRGTPPSHPFDSPCSHHHTPTSHSGPV
ncbi:hypothetical protein MMC07_006192 [Pseudocyphellaria aurata]|nr:hypothetical protein [Pseudocyphellaria aurata]